MAKKKSSDVGKAVGIGAPAAAGGAIGFALGGPVGAAIGTFLGGLLGAIGVGKVEEKERQAEAQTDPFLEEKKEVIRRLLQISPYLPDMSYSDFAKMLGIENGKSSFSNLANILFSDISKISTPLFPIFNPYSLLIFKALDQSKKGGKGG